MTQRIFYAILTAVSAVLLLTLGSALWVLYGYFAAVQHQHLSEELRLAALATEARGRDYLQAVADQRYRLTWIAPDGTVLYDTQGGAEAMENHQGREEVKQALLYGLGSSSRYSVTLLEKTLYEAVLLKDGTVLRISLQHGTAATMALDLLLPFLLLALLAIALSALLARRLARRIVQPLNELSMEKPLENETYDELSPLLGRIHRQQEEIRRQGAAQQKQSAELLQLTEGMQEGFIHLDGRGIIRRINPAAADILGVAADCVGQDFHAVERRPDFARAVAAARGHGRSELRVSRAGREYQFRFSRIMSEAGSGIFLLILDVTDQVAAERSRREFTANVSHELKTPLQAILGSVELLSQGMVKAADQRRFFDTIHREARHLIALVEDILRLAQLDESRSLPREETDLGRMAQEIAAALQPMAEERQISLQVEAERAVLQGVPGLLYELLYNLVENAIRYNIPQGSVRLGVKKIAGAVSIQVEDSGIGIAEEHQRRIFERFYRVDKSHGRGSGGTGLGLAIVKHTVQYHGGTLALTSEVGKGTRIDITLPEEGRRCHGHRPPAP